MENIFELAAKEINESGKTADNVPGSGTSPEVNNTPESDNKTVAPEPKDESPDTKKVESQPEQPKTDGFQKRINQLTAKYKSELEKQTSEIASLREQIAKLAQPSTKEEDEIPEMETVQDLLKYNKEFMSKYAEKAIAEEVKKQLQLVSQSMLKQTEEQKINSKKEKFYTAVVDKYSDQFDGTEFIGDENTLTLLRKVEQRFNQDPDYWMEIIDEHGLDGMVKLVNKKFGELTNTEKVKDIVDKASKAKVLTSSDKGVEDMLSSAKGLKGLLTSAASVIKQRK